MSFDCCRVIRSGIVLGGEVCAMRFWIGLFLGLIIGAAATAGYYEFWDPGTDEAIEASEAVDK